MTKFCHQFDVHIDFRQSYANEPMAIVHSVHDGERNWEIKKEISLGMWVASAHSSLLCKPKHAFRTYINVEHLSLQQLTANDGTGGCMKRIKIKCISPSNCSSHIFGSRLKSSQCTLTIRCSIALST